MDALPKKRLFTGSIRLVALTFQLRPTSLLKKNLTLSAESVLINEKLHIKVPHIGFRLISRTELEAMKTYKKK